MSRSDRPRVTLVTSNGWGLGHLSREIAISLAIGERAEVRMFTFSRGLPLASRFGIKGEFCPDYASTWVPEERWNDYVERRFRVFISEVEPDVVMFDGVAPYLGVMNAISDHPGISAGWLRRGMWLSGRIEAQLSKSAEFDFVIEPGDLAAEADHGPTSRLEAIRVAPVSLLETIPKLTREEAAGELGLDPTRPALLIAVGSGQPGEAAKIRQAALERALRHPDWQIAMVNSPLSFREPDDVPGVVQLTDVYPLVGYLDAFDAAISAAGYNSVHELIPAGVPTVLVPKSASNTDDQVTRASYLSEHGFALMASDDDPEEVSSAVDRLLGADGERLRSSLERAGGETVTGGARETAEILTSSPPIGIRDSGPDEEWRQPGLKGVVKRAIGPRGVALVQRVLGRAPEEPRRSAVSLDPGDSGKAHLLVTSDVRLVTRSPEQPIEHILPGSSAAYERTRRALIEEFYEIPQ